MRDSVAERVEKYYFTYDFLLYNNFYNKKAGLGEVIGEFEK